MVQGTFSSPASSVYILWYGEVKMKVSESVGA